MSDIYSTAARICKADLWTYQQTPKNNISVSYHDLYYACLELRYLEENSKTEGNYGKPMVFIGIYISLASLFCVIAMSLDLLYGFRNRKLWFPTKYFSLNAASITVITVAMKLPVDLSSPMPDDMDQTSKVVGLAFMCTMISNLMPSLASMDNKSLLANVTGLSILVITLIVNIFIQIRTQVISPSTFYVFTLIFRSSMMTLACIYMGMLLFLLMILISSALTIPASKKKLEYKYQTISKKTLNDQHSQENLLSTIEKLRQLVKKYWIMAETGSPQFVMASTPLSFASGIICLVSMLIYILIMMRVLTDWGDFKMIGILSSSKSVYKWSMNTLVITQSIGIVVGSIAPIFRCVTILTFKSFAKHNLVIKVEKYWTQQLCEWKESGLSFLPSGRRSRALLHNLKNCILSFCIGFQKVIVLSCKIIGLFPIVIINFAIYCLYHFKSLKATPGASSSDDTDDYFSNYFLLLEDNMTLPKKTMKRILYSMNLLIRNAEKKCHSSLLKLLEKSVSFNGVETFDTNQIQSLLPIELANSWSLPIISLTCIAIVIPNIHMDAVDNLFKCVGEGLFFTHIVEESLNKACEYVNIRRTSMSLWDEVDANYKWLETTLKRSAYEGKTPREIIKSFAHSAQEILDEFKTSANGEVVEKENLPRKVIISNSMYRIAQTIMHTYESNNLEITEDELFTRLSNMIADIFAACLTNIPRVVIMKCHESAIEKREASVMAAIDLLGRTTEIIERLETRVLRIDQDKMAFIDEWRLHLRQP